jgi:hypothetical protein
MNARNVRQEPDAAVLARQLPVPAERDLPSSRRHVLREHLMQEFNDASSADRPVASRRRPRTALLATGAAAAVLAVSVTAVALNQSPAPVQPGRTPAVRLLDKIAYTAGRQPAPRVRDDQFEYIKSKVAFEVTSVNANGKVTNSMEEPHQRQIWKSVSDLCRPGLLRDQGTTKLGRNQGEKCPDRGSLNDPTYRLLASLPTSPPALLDLINTQEMGHGPSPDAEAFTTIGDLLRESIAPPRISAALYRAAALIPGVTVIPNAVDAIGRHGVAVAFTSQGTRTEWIFDKTSLQMLGEREVTVRTGSVTGTTAILERAFVDRAGQLPHRSARL